MRRVGEILAFRKLKFSKRSEPAHLGLGSQVQMIRALKQFEARAYLSKEDEIEARDIKLAAALNVQLQDGGLRRVTAAQAVTMLVEINGKTEETDKESRAEDSRRR